MTHSIHYWYRSLLFLLLFYVVFSISWSIISSLVLKLDRKGRIKKIVNYVETKIKPLNMVARFTCLAFGFVCGLAYQDILSYRTSDEIKNITIVDRRPNHVYDYVFRGSDTVYTTRICDTFDPEFPVGSSLEFIKFENRVKCWDVSGAKYGYKYIRDRKVEFDASR